MRQNPQATLPIYRRLPFSQLFLYEDEFGEKIDLTGKPGRLQLREDNVDNTDPPLYEFSTDNGKMLMGDGTIELTGMTEVETTAFPWDEAFGHLVVEEAPGDSKVFIYLRFHVFDTTTDVPV